MGYAIASSAFLLAGLPFGLFIRWAYTKTRGAGNVERARTTP